MKQLLFSLFICLAPALSAQLLTTQGQAIVNDAGDTIHLKGMGLGGWMVQEGYMLQTSSFANPQHQIRAKIEELIGSAATQDFYDAWLANHVTEADIDSLKNWGFNSVRLPMHYNLYTLPIEDEPVPGEQTFLTKGFELTDSLIAWCAAREMYVVLDLHAAPGGQGYDEGISDYDPTKPSLWESPANRDKTVALWQRLAERYADEPWVAGYDLINEPNWNLPGGTLLRQLYEEITDSIRTVDPDHIIFIEGNWFANDFTGLTPPWDDQLVYSPHKYWSFNDEGSMLFATGLREQYNVPLYLGETGENSNVWFRDAILLFEDLDMGWAWWPMKKVESIAGPLSVEKTPGYQALLDYWEGNGPQPTAAEATAALMDLTDGLLIENCRYQKDVIDAMFRQTKTEETVPFNVQDIPGVVYASDFSMGPVGSAYYDNEVANYRVSTGTFTSWNNGWVYRNDGIDLEICQDDQNTNGINVGWIGTDEWMQYDVDVAQTGVYDLNFRIASGGEGGSFQLEADGAAITPSVTVPGTGDWQTWQTVTVPNVIVQENVTKLRFHALSEGYNLSSIEFVDTGADPTTLPTNFVSAETADASTVTMSVSKPLTAAQIAGFEIRINNSPAPILSASLDADNPRLVHFGLDVTMTSSQTIRISYVDNDVTATDGTKLTDFNLRPVRNTLRSVLPVPGRVEAEDFFAQTGVQLETTTDAGGGQNIGYLDPGDFLDYDIDVATTTTYQVDYRHASEADGGMDVFLVDAAGAETLLASPQFPATGGWQTWTTQSGTLALPAGRHVLRLRITAAPFNLNWMEFSTLTSSDELPEAVLSYSVSPNPTHDLVDVVADLDGVEVTGLEVRNIHGKSLRFQQLDASLQLRERLSLRHFPNGMYLIGLQLANGTVVWRRVLKQ